MLHLHAPRGGSGRRVDLACQNWALTESPVDAPEAVVSMHIRFCPLGCVDSWDSLLGANQIQGCFWEAVLGVMDRLVLSDAAWERMAPLIIGRPDQKGSTGRDNRM